MSPASVTRLSERIRHIQRQDDKIAEVARDVEQLTIRREDDALAMHAIADAQEAQAATLDRIEDKLDRALGYAQRAAGAARRAEDTAEAAHSLAREAHASDVDLTATIEREREAAERRDAEVRAMRAMMEPIIADASRKAGNAASAKTAGAISVGALMTGLAAQPAETIRLLREIGPAGAGVLVLSLLVGLWFQRRRSSRTSIPPPALPPAGSP
jgi:hypothetical protein